MLLAVVVVVVVTLSALFEFPANVALTIFKSWLVVVGGGVSLDDAEDDAAPLASFLLFCFC